MRGCSRHQWYPERCEDAAATRGTQRDAEDAAVPRGTQRDAEDVAASRSTGAADILTRAKAAKTNEDLFLEGVSETLLCPSAGLLRAMAGPS